METENHKLGIGDLVKPTKEALKRNREFTEDKRFVVTSVTLDNIWEEGPIWYDIALEGQAAANHCLPENELELVKKFEW